MAKASPVTPLAPLTTVRRPCEATIEASVTVERRVEREKSMFEVCCEVK